MCSERPGSLAGIPGGTFTSTSRRAQFIGAAIETIAEVGYAHASLGRIAERVGVSKGVISYHFAGRAELILEVLASLASEGGAFMYERSMALPTASEQLRGWIESGLAYLVARPAETVAFYEISAARGDQAVTAAVAELNAGAVTALRDMLADGQASGEFRADFDPEALALTLIAVVDAVPSRMLRDPDFDVPGYGREIAGLFEAATRPR